MALEKIVRNWIGGAVLTLASCATSFQPKDDYNNYPGYKKEIALYNLRGILQESCTKSIADENGFSCEWNRCVNWQEQYVSNLSYGSSGSAGGYHQRVCSQTTTERTSYQWQQLQSLPLIQEGNCLKFSPKAECDVETKTVEQAAGFTKALKVYLGQL